LGNKSRISKYLAPILTEHLNGENWYIEPFAGAFGMISNINYPNRIAYDKDKYIIALMKAVRDGWTPDFCSELKYQMIKDSLTGKNDLEFSDEEIGFAGYGCSFGGKWFAGFARGGISGGKIRNHSSESSRNLVKMRPKLQGIKIQVSNYEDAKLGEGNSVYLDPPYSTGTKYKSEFDHNLFWEWVRNQSKVNYVYTSEYNSPEDFIPVWEKEHKSGIHHGFTEHKSTIEKLFIWNNEKNLIRLNKEK